MHALGHATAMSLIHDANKSKRAASASDKLCSAATTYMPGLLPYQTLNPQLPATLLRSLSFSPLLPFPERFADRPVLPSTLPSFIFV